MERVATAANPDLGNMDSLRFEPPRVAATSVLRADLIERLRLRFERRATVIEAGAGFGKSTLLAQSIRENRIEQLGVDVWLRLVAADRSPLHLRRGLGTALGVTGDDPTVDALVEAVWSRAPESVALVLDDVHVLEDARDAWATLEALLDRLPGNGHLVVSGRRPPLLPIARLRSRDDAVVLDETDLAFTDADLAALAALRDLPPDLIAELPRWPALATLTGVVGHRASIDYVWDEVLSALPPDRQQLLGRLAPFGEIDDRLVAALGGEMAAAELVDGLPLVDATDAGTYRLHDLWIDALASTVPPAERDAGLRRGAEELLGRGDLVRAAEAFALAGDEGGFREVVVAFACRPTLRPSVPEMDRLHALLPSGLRDDPAARYLEAARLSAIDDHRSVAGFRLAAQAAREAGDLELETLARWRVIQFEDLETIGGPGPTPRLQELADAGAPRASAVLAFLESRRAQMEGDSTGALEALSGLDGFEPEQRAGSLAIRLVDLGRPETIPATLDDVLASGISDINAALAVWLQGAIDPTDAWPLARELPSRAEAMPVGSRVSLISVLATMAVAAGEHDEARALADDALRLAPSSARTVHLFAEVAAALVDLVTVGEEFAVETLVRLLEEVPLGSWPERPYLYAVGTVRALVPGTEMLDSCAFGPSLSIAVEAGAALAALRGGNLRPAAMLPWSARELLRVHVPPPLLAELALAVDETEEVRAVLASIPHLRTWARRIADRHRGPVGERAQRLVATLPARPDYDIEITLLGGLAIRRSDGRSVEGWDRRERVRQLLALLAMEREVPRSEAASRLWPDLPADKAAANLRVNLHHLQQALQPDRDAGDPPWFVQADPSRLRLATEGLVTDREELDRAMEEAVRAEAAGLATRALACYRRASQLYQGDLLPDLEGEWVEYERIRLRSVAHAATARCGELELARGEPEQAMRLASRAMRLDPLSERAHRLFLRSHLALGSVSSARDAAHRLRAQLERANVTPEPETRVLLERLDV